MRHVGPHDHPALAVGLPDGLLAYANLDTPRRRLRVPAWDLDLDLAHDASPVARAFEVILDALSIERADVEVDSRLSPGVGMGSSAALAVAVARALATASGEAMPFSRLDPIAHAAERVFHGNPSGIDHAVAALGGVLKYRRGEQPQPQRLGAPLPLVVAVAAPGASTLKMVEGVHARLDRHPLAVGTVMNAIHQLVDAATQAIAVADWPALGEMMDINHGLLMSLGVSTPTLDAAVHVARDAGALGAKLTGAGGGGCIVALAPGCQREVAAALAPSCARVFCPTIERNAER